MTAIAKAEKTATTEDEFLQELCRQCCAPTHFDRLNADEQLAVVRWFLDNGHMSLTGKPLLKPLPHPAPSAYANDGAPLYKPGTDFSTHETFNLPAATKR